MSSMDEAHVPAARPHVSATTEPDIFYKAVWRWHFYAGLYVIPILAMLALTGLVMLWSSTIAGRDGEWIAVSPTGAPKPVSTQADAAVSAVDQGILKTYIAPRADNLAAIFRVDSGDAAVMVAVDPYTGAVLSQVPRRDGLYDLASDIHGTMLLGVTGDRMIEIGASLAIVMLVTGLFLWWPRQKRLWSAVVPDLNGSGRTRLKNLHSTIGIWTSLLLLAFLISGLSWAGIWGEKFVQAWNTFPAEKWDSVPLSDTTHASLNTGTAKEVPWPLEQTPLPASGSKAGVPGLSPDVPVTLDNVVAFARNIGFEGRVQVSPPQSAEGVWTLSRDSMSNDSADPMSDRTVHLDRYTGRILADVRFEDYSVYGKAMAVGIAFHEGDLGLWNVILNTVFCLSVLFLCGSGLAMWWMRRPHRAGRLAAPPIPNNLPLWRGAILVGLAVALAFPMAGLTLLWILALDQLLISRLPVLKRALS